MQSFELFQEQVPAFAGMTCESVHLCVALDKAEKGYMLDLTLMFLRYKNKHNLLHVLPGIDRASALACKESLRSIQQLAIMQSFELFQEQVPAFAGMTGKSVYLCITLDKARTAICSILLLRFYAV